MGEVAPSHDAVRIYLDSAVAEAAERWVGRATDATAYADLVAAVLARREALSPMYHVAEPIRREPAIGEPPPSRPAPPSRHHERRSRPRWPLGSPTDRAGSAADRGATPVTRPEATTGRATVDVRQGAGRTALVPPTPLTPLAALPTRAPGRHRTPAAPPEGAEAIDLNRNLGSVLDWLGRPEA